MSNGISEDILRELQDSVVARPVSVRLQEPSLARAPVADHPVRRVPTRRASSSDWGSTLISLVPWFIGAGMVIAGLLYVSQYGLRLKARVVEQGNAAISSLIDAKSDLDRLDFAAAQSDFSLAYDQFEGAQQDLGIIGTGVGRVLAKIPGAGSLRAAQDLLEAGRLISQAGSALSKAVSGIAASGALLDPSSSGTASQVLGPLKDALDQADHGITQATALLKGIEVSSLPPDAQEQFQSFMDRLPHVQALVSQGHEGIAFVMRLMGSDQPRRYLLLFQNSSELRPTGGFPGSYGLATFDNGRLRDLAADDIYNPDGQLKQLIVPPKQLQHITPTWGMRDANWFIDFPTSARKVMEFYRKDGGSAVDGVITLRPDLIASLLKVTGPISLPEYDVVLTSENFLPTIQSEVESKKSPAPKKIIMDLAPLLLAKLSTLPPQQWVGVVNLFQKALAQHDMLMYMDDRMLEQYVVAQRWDGRVQDMPGDYLTVNVANIKGAKADAVTDTSIKLESWLENGAMVHRMTLVRHHNGGASEYGFYNKTNYSYVRVLVPKGSTLRGLVGNDRPLNQPMMNYSGVSAMIDPDLARLEKTYQYDPANGSTTSEESGKTGFGFWMKIQPGETQSVQLEYVVPAAASGSDYHLTVQRQPGLDVADFEFTFQKNGALKPISSSIPLVSWPDSWRFHDSLDGDLQFRMQLQ